MPKALVTYFTGTGNSLRAAGLIIKELEKSGYAVNLKKVDTGTEIVKGYYDLYIFLYPVYACRVPSIMIRYLKCLPKVSKSRAVVISIFGDSFFTFKNKKFKIPGYEGQALVQAEKILKAKGYDVSLTEAIGYPANITNIINPPTEEEQDILFKDGDEKVAALSCDIINQVRRIKSCNFIVQGFIWVFGFLFEMFGRRAIGKWYVADNNCNGCEKCKNACPSNTIKMFRRKPVWDYNCEGCQRCINICPMKAIQVSIVRVLGMIALMFIRYDIFIIKYLGINSIINSNIYIRYSFKAGLLIIGYIISIYLLDKLLFLLERLPIINCIFHWSYTKRYRRYLEPNFNP